MLLHTILSITLATGPSVAPATPGIPAAQLRSQELLQVAFTADQDDDAGEPWRYSNTNYVVAGLLIEKLTGRLIGYLTFALTDGRGRSMVLSLNPYEQDPPTAAIVPLGVAAFCR
ncbi:serine hydrolase [Saccharothrix australiensis]|uniref:serine hydrolase n=1 Tax=Saccharothrix australiensis TaxID=2072 RepID=UPI000EAC1348|nr:serine hydrolase [Saccharothrix australiensis]